jgi:hypothetical protein
VVPRAWTIHFAEIAGTGLADDLPVAWLEAAEAEAGHPLPRRLRDEPLEQRDDVAHAVASVVDEVRRRIFPRHGLG